MRVESIDIKNFRSIAHCKIEFLDLLAIIGENNAGKSNIIYALNLFLNQNKANSEYDYLDPAKSIEIIVSFKDFSDDEKKQINDAHRTDDRLIIKKIYPFDEDVKTTSVKNGEETNITPRGPQNILADTLPELYILPAIKEISSEVKITTTTNLGKLFNEVIENTVEGFEEADNLLSRLKTFFESDDPTMPLNKLAVEITGILNRQFSATSVKLVPKTLTRKDVLKALDIMIDDGLPLSIYQKGHGLQRAVIFAILCLWADRLNAARPVAGKAKKGIIIAIEEPEIYLHPQQQRNVYEILKRLSSQETEQIQILYSTHSSFLVHVEDYRNIALVRKPSTNVGTLVAQCEREIFPPASKDEFSLLCQFDPERNELFFARKIVLVEGDTEKMSLPIILNKVGLNPTGSSISIVECGSKASIHFFIDVISAFNESEKLLDCIVMHDKDVPWRDANDPDKAAIELQAEALNKEISQLCLDKNIPLYVFESDFENELGIVVGNKNKPYNAKKAVAETSFVVKEKLKNFLETHLN